MAMPENFDVKKATEEAQNGNGCQVSNRLSLIGLTDQISVLDAIKEQNAKNRQADSSIPEVFVDHIQVEDIRLELKSKSWLAGIAEMNDTIYTEDYNPYKNSSKVRCWDQSSQPDFVQKSFELKF
jgi:hypothetical protein